MSGAKHLFGDVSLVPHAIINDFPAADPSWVEREIRDNFGMSVRFNAGDFAECIHSLGHDEMGSQCGKSNPLIEGFTYVVIWAQQGIAGHPQIIRVATGAENEEWFYATRFKNVTNRWKPITVSPSATPTAQPDQA